jgi:hypothetical protein
MKIDEVAVIIGIVVPVSFLAITITSCLLIRRLRSNHRYSQVNHELDEEEIEFKKILDKKKFDDDIYMGDDDDDEDEVKFDAKDLDRLNMLERYRSNLVAGATSALEIETESDNGENEKEELRL